MAATLLLFCFGLVLVYFSPADYQQGNAVRIMYLHVPAAGLALFIYFSMGVAGLCYLIWKLPLSVIYIHAAAPLGLIYALLCLITGSIWGKPMWGTWWVWDARLTSMLILFFFYCSIVAFTANLKHGPLAYTLISVLAIAGALNVPIVKFSVDWWQTLHQPASLFRASGPAIDASMVFPLLVMYIAFLCHFFYLLLLSMETLVLRLRIARLLQNQAR